MNEGRNGKIEEQVREISARFIERESNKTALITVTRVEVYERGRSATVYFSVLPVTSEEAALNFLKRKRAELREVIKKQMNVRTIPFIDVAIDSGEKARQTIDALLKE
jgi:ribosome-binding factor A